MGNPQTQTQTKTQAAQQRRAQDVALSPDTDGDTSVVIKHELGSFDDILSTLDASSSYMLSQQAGVASPALSLISGSSHSESARLSAPPQHMATSSPLSHLSLDHGVAPLQDQPLMFPALSSTAFTDGAADAAALDGWLQQYVNVDALDGTAQGSLTDDRASSPMDTSGLLDASAVEALAQALSSDVLASIMAGGPGCELLPFATGLATPVANVAPQQTIAMTAVLGDTGANPARKRQRSAECCADSAATTAAGETLSERSNEGEAVTARASSSLSSSSVQARASSSSCSPQARAVGGRRLAPRQPATVQANGSGATTPPGLSVLAKTAQHQPPLLVKREPAPSPMPTQTPKATQRAASPEVAVAQKRQERLIKNRAAALLSRKRKREYMSKLEGDVEQLRESNEALLRRLEDLERRLGAVTAERDMLRGVASPASTATVQTNAAASSTVMQQTDAAAATAKKQKTERSADTSSPSTQKPQASACLSADGIRQQPNKPVAAPTTAPAVATPPPAKRLPPARSQAIRPRVAVPASAPPPAAKQPRAGALLMAVLFSFSLFTLPSLYSGDHSLSVGGEQSAGILPLPAAPARLLLPGSSEPSVQGAPLIERVRRKISAMAQQHVQDEPPANQNDTAADQRVRPMTMEESVDLRAWISHALVRPKDSAPAVVRPSAAAVSGGHADYAMMYCPSMRHVMFADVLPTQQQSASGLADPAPRISLGDHDMHDVDDVIASLPDQPGASESSLQLVPTQAGRLQAKSRPKMSFYSPVAAAGLDAE
ncbi:hypothetical protein LPJ73_004758, partial [Coemansia sp. RSA 2703]